MMNIFKTTALAGAIMMAACTSSAAGPDDKQEAKTMSSMEHPSDRAQIEAAVMDYFEGQGQGSFERLDRAFNDKSSMFGVVADEDGNEGLKVWADMNEVVRNWSKNPNPDAPRRDGEITDYHVTDGRIATVHFRSTDRFYDVLTLVKINGEWEIASKVFVRQ